MLNDTTPMTKTINPAVPASTDWSYPCESGKPVELTITLKLSFWRRLVALFTGKIEFTFEHTVTFPAKK